MRKKLADELKRPAKASGLAAALSQTPDEADRDRAWGDRERRRRQQAEEQKAQRRAKTRPLPTAITIPRRDLA